MAVRRPLKSRSAGLCGLRHRAAGEVPGVTGATAVADSPGKLPGPPPDRRAQCAFCHGDRDPKPSRLMQVERGASRRGHGSRTDFPRCRDIAARSHRRCSREREAPSAEMLQLGRFGAAGQDVASLSRAPGHAVVPPVGIRYGESPPMALLLGP